MVATSAEFQARIAQTEAFMLKGAEKELGAAVTPADAVAYFRAGGYEIPEAYQADFEAMYAVTIAPDLALIHAAARGELDTWPSLKCSACQVTCFVVAGLIFAVGTSALGGLTTSSACVTALAELVGCTAQVALAFIKTLGDYMLKGVAAVVNAICVWTGTC